MHANIAPPPRARAQWASDSREAEQLRGIGMDIAQYEETVLIPRLSIIDILEKWCV